MLYPCVAVAPIQSKLLQLISMLRLNIIYHKTKTLKIRIRDINIKPASSFIAP